METPAAITRRAGELKNQLQAQGYWTTDDAAKRRVLNRIRWISSELDRKWKLCGWWRIGYDSLLSIIPGGSLIGMCFSLYLFAMALRFDLPTWERSIMLARIAFDALIGSIPIIGFFADSVYKANIKNMQTLETSLIRSLPPQDVQKLGIPLGPDGQPYDMLSDHDGGLRADEIVLSSRSDDGFDDSDKKMM